MTWAHQWMLYGAERCPLVGGLSSMVNLLGASDMSAVERLSAFRRVLH